MLVATVASMPWNGDFPTKEEIAVLHGYLQGSVADSWNRCLPIWLNSDWKDESHAHGGRVDDLPAGVRRTRYTPSPETTLGRFFVERYRADYRFLLERLANCQGGERLCAFDLLVFLARDLYAEFEPLPAALRECVEPLPEEIRERILDDRIYKRLPAPTVGALLAFEHNGQGPPDETPDPDTKRLMDAIEAEWTGGVSVPCDLCGSPIQITRDEEKKLARTSCKCGKFDSSFRGI
jgi:hypothetical protein